MEIGAQVGVNLRSERGHTLGGARLEGNLRRASSDEAGLEFGGAFTQVTAYYGAHGEGSSVKENALEAFVRWERQAAKLGAARLFVSGGPVLGYAIGCTAGGDFLRDHTGYGSADCTNSFANKGTFRPGADGRVTLRASSGPASFVLGVDAAVGTVAAGNSVVVAPFVGFRARYR